MRVTIPTLSKDYGTPADKALSEPVTITKNGLDRLVAVSADQDDRLIRRYRRAIRPEYPSEDDLAPIAKAEAPA